MFQSGRYRAKNDPCAPVEPPTHTHTFPPTRFAHGPKILTSILCWYPAQGLLRQLVSLIIFCITNMLYVGTITPEILNVVKLDLDIVPPLQDGPSCLGRSHVKAFHIQLLLCFGSYLQLIKSLKSNCLTK